MDNRFRDFEVFDARDPEATFLQPATRN